MAQSDGNLNGRTDGFSSVRTEPKKKADKTKTNKHTHRNLGVIHTRRELKTDGTI
jgi:hypothetical protein